MTISKAPAHESIATTARYLYHLSNDRAVTAVAALDRPEVSA